MLKLVSKFVVVAAALFALAATAQPSNVTLLSPPQPVENDGKIEVLEFFAYGCIHCASLEPVLEEWVKKQAADVKLVRVPHLFEIRGIDSRPLFYGLQAMGQIERLHNKIFVAVNNENVNLAVPSVRNKWLQANGVDPAKYEEVVASFSVQNRIKSVERKVVDYKINGTPMMAVNGRASVNTETNFARMLSTVDQLIAEARAANGRSAGTAPDGAAKAGAKPTKATAKPPAKAAAKPVEAK